MTTSILLLATEPWRAAHPAWLALLALAPVAFLAAWHSARRRRAGLRQFVGDAAAAQLPRSAMTWTRGVIASIGAASLAVAAARPQSDPVTEEVAVRGRDLVFLVDVSRSMLSRDVVPDRLSRTKIWINDLVNTLGGDRVALVAFAGVPVVKCPLTLDHGFFRMELDDLSPATSPRGGTLIGDAIRKAMSDVFEPGQGRHRDIILFTDGEDQGSFPVEAAKAAGEAGVRIIAIGIGSELEGSPVPTDPGATGYIEHEGSQVRSRLDGTTLAAVAHAAREAGGQGVFLNVGTGTMDLDTIYRDLIASAESVETSQVANVIYRELFPWFVGLALVCFVVEPLIPLSRRPRRDGAGSMRRAGVAAMALASMTLLSPGLEAAQPATDAPAPSPAEVYNEGRRLFLEGKHAEAADRFRAADVATRDAALGTNARYNLGLALYRQAVPAADASPAASPGSPDAQQRLSLLEAASRAFQSALEIDPTDQAAARNVELCRRRMQEIRDEQQRQQQEQRQQEQSKEGNPGESQGSQGQPGDRESQSQEISDLARRQREAAEQSGKAQTGEPGPDRDRDAKAAQRTQQQLNEDTRRRQDSSTQPTERASEELEKAREAQRQASEALERGDLGEASKRQEQAAEHLESAAAAEREAARTEQASRADAKSESRASETRQPAYDQTASQLLDRERRLREARRQAFRAMRGTPQPVERDW